MGLTDLRGDTERYKVYKWLTDLKGDTEQYKVYKVVNGPKGGYKAIQDIQGVVNGPKGEIQSSTKCTRWLTELKVIQSNTRYTRWLTDLKGDTEQYRVYNGVNGPKGGYRAMQDIQGG